MNGVQGLTSHFCFFFFFCIYPRYHAPSDGAASIHVFKSLHIKVAHIALAAFCLALVEKG